MRRARHAGVAALLTFSLVACKPADPERIVAERYDSFWLWAGVRPPPFLKRALTLYLLDGEIRAREPGRYVALRPGVPAVPGKSLWLVVRTDTLDWPHGGAATLVQRLDAWRAAGNRVEGLQVDFDARTRGLHRYAEFLRSLRRELPASYRLSVTGLMDWSANADAAALGGLRGSVDEVVVQTYQGRDTIVGYERWLAKLRGFPLPFKLGVVQGGGWHGAGPLEGEANFRGYVVFLVDRPGGARR